MNAPRMLFGAALLTVALAAGCSNSPAAATPAPGSSSAPTSAAASAGTSVVSVTLTPAGCVPDKTSVPAGSVTFNATNQGADAVSELELKQGDQVIAEKENLTPGLSGSFTVTLAAGSYVLECPGATSDESDFTVTP